MFSADKPAAGRLLLDDTVPLAAVIEASQTLQSHTEYIIRVQRGVSSENTWQVIRRYSDFDMLNSSLQVSGISLSFPPKKLIGNMDREFIAERQRGLQAYLDYITQNPLLSSSEAVKKFLDPNSYSSNYTEIALQQVSMYFRSDPRWEVVEPLKDIGWRLRKQYFLIRCREQPKDRHLLSWVDLGPDKFLSDKDLQAVMKLLTSMTHPCVCPVVFCSTSESSALVIRPFSERGTLRDLIYKVKVREPYLRKYCNPRKSQGLELHLIQHYGRHILEGLRFLQDQGIPYGHLQSSNVLLQQSPSPLTSDLPVTSDLMTCSLLDVENSLLGLPSFYRPLVTQQRRLNSILSTEAFKTGPPTICELIQTHYDWLSFCRLFRDVQMTLSDKQQFKTPSRLKEALRSSKELLERRLQEEQRQIYQHRRLTRAQSHHGSEEQKKRRKLLARKKSRQSAYENEEESSVKYNNNSGLQAPPPPPPAPHAPPSCQPPPPPSSNGLGGRGALLSSIQGFSKAHLKKTETVDHS
ncbi:PX domain-containing protein kinase-like protein [Merluccius polli]|uniref:PX domain-containing protein kinase-like protein n=1 Tax=Merluccius polli TaxID=89951 RepID=A0AA47P319_MERPO|nr:PX domain-containing protein kinase-like protein [Merluccius polli]